MTSWWDDEVVVGPVRLLLDEIAVGEELVDLDRLYEEHLYVELLFRSLVQQEWRDWPPEWTTDGGCTPPASAPVTTSCKWSAW